MLDDTTLQRFAELGIAQRAALENAPHDGTTGRAYFAADGSLVATREQGSPWPEPTDSTLIVREYPGTVIRLIGEQRRDYRLVNDVLVKVADGTPVSIPELPVPESCTNDQARLALIEFGVLPEAVDSALDAIEDAGRKARLQVMWNYRQTFRRDNDDLQDMASALGLNDEQLDALFRLAVTL